MRRTLSRRRFRLEGQANAIHAIAQAGRLGAVLKDVAEMTAAAAAMHLDALHEERIVLSGADGLSLDRLPKARPTGSALVLGCGIEQRQIATGTNERTLALLMVEGARSRRLGAMLAQH